MMRRELVLGGPGAGKTERLLVRVEEVLAEGTRPEEVAFVSFTRSAVAEAGERFSRKFGFPKTRARYFRTLHSLCFRQLGIRRDQVAGPRELAAFGRELGVRLTGRSWEESPTVEGDRLLFLVGLAKATGESLRSVWEEDGEVEWPALEWFARAYAKFKEAAGKIDFSDMLDDYVASGDPLSDVKFAVIDEAQDLTRAQWRVVEKAFGAVPCLIVAGDDDQAIHEWAGADLARFRRFPADAVEVLPKSHRLPDKVFELSKGVIGRVSDRYEKEWSSSGREGSVEWLTEEADVDLDSGDWLLLGRTRTMLKRFEVECQVQGVSFETKGVPSVDQDDVRAIVAHERLRRGKEVSEEDVAHATFLRGSGEKDQIWHEALVNMPPNRRAYYLTMLRKGVDLRARPRIRLDTIHGAKGREASNVVLLTDTSQKSSAEAERRPDAELRVLYTGLTRTKERLVLVGPKTGYFFQL